MERMSGSSVYLGDAKLHRDQKEVTGEFVSLHGELYYRIGNYDAMDPFFLTLVSDSNHWMYLSSLGGLSAGRINPDSALFPYYTDDKIHENSASTGSKSIFLIRSAHSKSMLWEPFSTYTAGIYKIKRNLYKNTTGNKLLFEEVNLDLQLTYQYTWMNSDRFGWIKKSSLVNNSTQAKEIRLLDGLQNLLPYGIQQSTQANLSTLMDAYKKSELIPGCDLAIFRMSSIPVDRPEPSEALKATTVWSFGLKTKTILLTSAQLDGFRLDMELEPEKEARGVRASFFVESRLNLEAKSKLTWYMIAEVNQEAHDIIRLKDGLENKHITTSDLESDVDAGTQNLIDIVASSDGVQQSPDLAVSARHFSNVLFNVMRGGIFLDGYSVSLADFRKHLIQANRNKTLSYQAFLAKLPDKVHYRLLLEKAMESGDSHLIRHCLEYLPLTFSRRHGDPSRPWNYFSINIKNPDGSRRLDFQGNWRDIFQNWEALAYSFPVYLKGMIAKFLNASTADGYNPYRLTRDGFDWEVHDPDDPWSYIGYWGDHQVIYQLKLLELAEKFLPGVLNDYLNRNWFSFAHLPYRIKTFRELLEDPYKSIDFDGELDNILRKRLKEIGSDGALVQTATGDILLTSLMEKMLLLVLTKISNFIPEAGIWLNTQRPEWNDANNALVGNGASMVTLYYLRRYVNFMLGMVKTGKHTSYEISIELYTLFTDVNKALHRFRNRLAGSFSAKDRMAFLEAVGHAGSDYREIVYKQYSGECKEVVIQNLSGFLQLVLEYLDHSIHANKRTDRLYHAYNLLEFTEDEIHISHLPEMLEGQVAVISSGSLEAEEVGELLGSMQKSALYREDQHSYTLYPDKKIPDFLERNLLSKDDISKIPFLVSLAGKDNSSILRKDLLGTYHFNGSLKNADDLKKNIRAVSQELGLPLSDADEMAILDLFEKQFHHRAFTGRSGTFFKYEGLGSIYWHMVSKLQLAVGEHIQRATDSGDSLEIIKLLREFYFKIREGVGVHKNPALYGSFPTDPYSHTPSMSGVQQPGMTGQVKEDIISRWMELGISIKEGRVFFSRGMMQPGDITDTKEKSVSYTFCSVPVFYSKGTEDKVIVYDHQGEGLIQQGMSLDKETSQEIFNRSGRIQSIHVRYK